MSDHYLRNSSASSSPPISCIFQVCSNRLHILGTILYLDALPFTVKKSSGICEEGRSGGLVAEQEKKEGTRGEDRSGGGRVLYALLVGVKKGRSRKGD